jgi:hypothetical protein
MRRLVATLGRSELNVMFAVKRIVSPGLAMLRAPWSAASVPTDHVVWPLALPGSTSSNTRTQSLTR